MEEEEDDSFDEISELPEYSPKSEFSKAQKVAEAVSKVIECRAKEMRPGYFNVSVDKFGMPQKSWIPDARVVFIGAVTALRSVLAPEAERDKKFKEAEAKLNEKIEKLQELYAYDELIEDYEVNAETNSKRKIYRKSGKKIIPEIGDILSIVIQDYSGTKVVERAGAWDQKVNRYRNSLIPIYDELFSELNKIIDRLNYFKAGMSF